MGNMYSSNFGNLLPYICPEKPFKVGVAHKFDNLAHGDGLRFDQHTGS